MEVLDATAVLVALAEPLEWNRHSLRRGAFCWIANWQQGERVRYAFTVSESQPADFGCDATGTPFWTLDIRKHQWVGADEGCLSASGAEWRMAERWSFPCRTVEEAKAVCERFVVMGDTAEVVRLDRLRYPLAWRSLRSFDSSCYGAAFVFRNGCPVAQYVVEYRERRFFPDYTASYELHGRIYKDHRDDAGFDVTTEGAYLEEFNLRPPSNSPRRYKTQADAKAACERHHAAGTWRERDE